ncbi:glycosyltransferase [Azoarcus sp. TTM-91]|uniref:glycosyltransferase family 4 protein n=1 Tax=Azoarcus sp. TTM-91 TaxID=2691581 RepID=UPI00145CF88C|nr:glycosyltransferase family 4 protein [Azoarcus sp. TTM-91]NMG33719.1 glycosyltransferase [Azoarcus sp. TTM-91]
MRFLLLSPFTRGTTSSWIVKDVVGHEVDVVPAGYAHDRSRPVSGRQEWADYYRHVRAALRRAGGGRAQGLITVFPQLAALAGLLKRLLLRSDLMVVAWSFNLGRTYGGLKGAVARFALAGVDMFVVHSRAEIPLYSRWLGLPESRFQFVPLSVALPAEGEAPASADEAPAGQQPFILALGTANRDYATLAAAVAGTGIPTLIVAGEHRTRHIQAPPEVCFRNGLALDECHRLARGARLNLVPLQDAGNPSGQVTLIEAMMRGCAIIATRCAGTEDYVEDGADALLVPAGDVAALRVAILSLWNDDARRAELGRRARERALTHYTFAAGGQALQAILDDCAPAAVLQQV